MTKDEIEVLEAMIATALSKANGQSSPWNFERVSESIKTLGFPLVMCGLMAWAFYDIGKMVFSEHIEQGRRITSSVERAMAKQDDMAAKHEAALFRIEKSHEKLADSMERLSKKP